MKKNNVTAADRKLGKELKSIRVSRGLKASWVADKLGISAAQLCHLEKGNRSWQDGMEERYRQAIAPYPLVEISSIQLAAGRDPIGNYERSASELPKHNPYADAVQSARLLAESLMLIAVKK